MQHTQSQVFLRSNLKTVKRAELAHLGSNPSPGRGQGYDIGLAGLKFVGSHPCRHARNQKRWVFLERKPTCTLVISVTQFLQGPSVKRQPQPRWMEMGTEVFWELQCQPKQEDYLACTANIHWGSASDLFRETCGWNLGWPTPIFRIGHIRGFCGRKQNFRRAVLLCFGGRNLNLNPHSQK